MISTAFVMLCCALSPAGRMPPQAGGVAADPITGTWTGYMGPGEANRTSITVNLTFDGKATVSGTITGPPRPGLITTGRFEPKTGALTLEVEVQGEGTIVAFEGTLEQGTISGRVRFNDQTGVFRITKKAPGESRLAAQSGSDEAVAAARRGFTEVSGWVARGADLVPADRYAYRPTASVRSFGQLVAHVADAYLYYCARAGGRAAPWSDAIEQGATDKATVVQRLTQAADACAPVYGGTGRIGPLIENVAHTSLHYGNMITYLRLLGLVPPSS